MQMQRHRVSTLPRRGYQLKYSSRAGKEGILSSEDRTKVPKGDKLRIREAGTTEAEGSVQEQGEEDVEGEHGQMEQSGQHRSHPPGRPPVAHDGDNRRDESQPTASRSARGDRLGQSCRITAETR